MAVVLVEFLLLLLLLVLSAFFSSSEVVFFSLNPLQIRRIMSTHPISGHRVEWILSSRIRLLSTILIGNTVVNVAIPVIIYVLVSRVFEHQTGAITGAISMVILMIFGEIGPKRIALAHSERLAIWYAPLVTFCIFLLAPIRFLLERITDAFSHLFQVRGRTLSDEEFETVVEVSEEEGVLDQEEKGMLKGIMRLEDLRASDVMTPRVDLEGVDLHDDDVDVDEVVKHARVRQLIIYRKSMDHVEGILDVRQYLLAKESPMRDAWKPAVFIPESYMLDQLLHRFLNEKCRAAVVVDEYGGTAGLVTRGDVLEEIFGDIEDEKGGHELLFEEIGEHRWVMDGQVSLEQIEEDYGLALEADGVDRISGWIMDQLGELPKPGARVQAENFTFIVRQMRRNRITAVEMVKKLEATNDEEADV